jgi:hypothetical protein
MHLRFGEDPPSAWSVPAPVEHGLEVATDAELDIRAHSRGARLGVKPAIDDLTDRRLRKGPERVVENLDASRLVHRQNLGRPTLCAA